MANQSAPVKKKTTKAPTKAPTKKAGAKKPASKTAKPVRKVTKETVNVGIQPKKRIKKPKVVSGFTEFLREQSVVGLAIGLVIGAQVKALADQMIASFINPLLGLLLPGTGALDKKVFILHIGEKSAPFAWGSFVAVFLSFTTTAAVIYFVFKLLKLDKLAKKRDA